MDTFFCSGTRQTTIKKNIKETNQIFSQKVWPDPTFQQLIGYGFIEYCETSEDKLKKDLDKYAGIDAVQTLIVPFYNERLKRQQTLDSVRTMAIRVRYKNWKSFTIRSDSSSGAIVEYDKRIEAIKRNTAYPNITVQAHIENNILISAAVIDTRTLYEYAYNHYIQLSNTAQWNKGKNDTQLFIIDWSKLINEKINFYYFDHSTHTYNLPEKKIAFED